MEDGRLRNSWSVSTTDVGRAIAEWLGLGCADRRPVGSNKAEYRSWYGLVRSKVVLREKLQSGRAARILMAVGQSQK
jgi:hypothetical protein